METVIEATKPAAPAPDTDTLEAVRAEVHALINQIDKPDVLQAMKVLLAPQVPEQENDFWQELTPETQARLIKSLESVKAGNVYDFQEVMDQLMKS